MIFFYEFLCFIYGVSRKILIGKQLNNVQFTYLFIRFYIYVQYKHFVLFPLLLLIQSLQNVLFCSKKNNTKSPKCKIFFLFCANIQLLLFPTHCENKQIQKVQMLLLNSYWHHCLMANVLYIQYNSFNLHNLVYLSDSLIIIYLLQFNFFFNKNVY